MAKSKTMKKLCSLMLSCCVVLGNIAVMADDDNETTILPEESQLQDIVNDDFTKLDGKEDADIRTALTEMGYEIVEGDKDKLEFSATEAKGLYMQRTGTTNEMQIKRAISDDNGAALNNTLLPGHNMKGGGKYYVDYTFAYDRTSVYINGAGNWKNVFCRTQITKNSPKELIVYGAENKYALSDVDMEMHVQTVVDTKTGNATGETPQCVSNVFVNGEHVAVDANNRYDYPPQGDTKSYYTTFLQNMNFILQGGTTAVDGGGVYLKNFRVSKIVESDSEMAEADKNELTLDKTDAITEDFTLPTTGSANGSEITWESSNSDVISIDGGNAVVTRPENDTEVILTATIKKGEASVTKEFTVTVNGIGVPEVEPGTNLTLGKSASGSFEAISGYDYSLMTDGVVSNSSRLALKDWENLANEYIDIDLGAEYTFNSIQIKEFQSRLKKFKLQYSLDKTTWTDIGEYTNTYSTTHKNWVIGFDDVKGRYVRLLIEENAKTTYYVGISIFEFEVYNLADETRAEQDRDALALDNTDKVKADFTLPTAGSINKSTITWESSNSDVIVIDGGNAVVTRPESDTAVILTATIQSGEAKLTKEFTVTVIAKDPPAAIEVGKNLALNKTVTGSKAACTGYGYELAADGKTNTRLALTDGKANGEWIQIDLGKNYKFNQVNIIEFRKRLKKFKLQYSSDGTTWTDIGEYSLTANNEDVNPFNHDPYKFNTAEGRYVRILIEENVVINKSQYLGVSLYEVEVYYNVESNDYVNNLSYTCESGNVNFSYERSTNAADADIYAAVYDSKGGLVYTTTAASGSFEGKATEPYTFKLFVWNSDMKSMCTPVIAE